MKYVRISPFTGKENEHDLPVTKKQLSGWQRGTPIQIAMPNLSADQREFLISGCLPGEFEKMFRDA